MKTNRDATNSFKGYEYQFRYFIKQIFENYKCIKTITFEGLEDIDIQYKNNNYSKVVVQVKYHSIKITENIDECFSKTSGFFKVLNAYTSNYQDTFDNRKIQKIIYYVVNEDYLHSTNEFKKFVDMPNELKKDFLTNKYTEFKYDDISSFSEKIDIIIVEKFNIIKMDQVVYDMINISHFFNIDTEQLFKKDIIYCKLYRELICRIFNCVKEIDVEKIFQDIASKINEEYTLKILVEEIINYSGEHKEFLIDNLMPNKMILNINDLFLLYSKKDKLGININNLQMLAKQIYIEIHHKIYSIREKICYENYKWISLNTSRLFYYEKMSDSFLSKFDKLLLYPDIYVNFKD